jgi:hypothetical protein
VKGLNALKELREASKQYPIVQILSEGMLELEEKYHGLERSKQDRPEIASEIAELNPNDLTRGSLQARLYKVLTSAGHKEQEVALKIHRFLSSLQ